MDNQDDSFCLTRDALKEEHKPPPPPQQKSQNKTKKQGRGLRLSKADAITDEEINILYEKNPWQ